MCMPRQLLLEMKKMSDGNQEVHRSCDRIIDLLLDLAIPSRQGDYRQVDACPMPRIF